MGKKLPIDEYIKGSEFFSGPNPKHSIIETHFHLDMIKQKDSKDIVSEFNSLGVSKALTISTSKKNWVVVENLTKKHNCLGFTLGTHPHQADDFSAKEFEALFSSKKSSQRLCAVGEIGLARDY